MQEPTNGNIILIKSLKTAGGVEKKKKAHTARKANEEFPVRRLCNWL
jgi:hypothetical protein